MMDLFYNKNMYFIKFPYAVMNGTVAGTLIFLKELFSIYNPAS